MKKKDIFFDQKYVNSLIANPNIEVKKENKISARLFYSVFLGQIVSLEWAGT